MSDHVYLPSYTIGEDAYASVPEICRPYGKMAVVIGGKLAMAAARKALEDAVETSALQLLDFIWYGGEASYENVELLSQIRHVKEADMLFGMGGGKALDCVKALGETLGKPVFTFPTIASNCAACTSVSIMYKMDGSFKNPWFFGRPPVHAFIQTDILAKAPSRYMWAGMGDTYAKYFESEMSSRGEEVPHYVALGVANASMCYGPIMKYGVQAMADNEKGLVTAAFTQVVLAIIATTAVASILLTHDRIIDYNTGLAHAIFYSLTTFPHFEEAHLHGAVVAYGILILLLVDGNTADFEKVYAFYRQVGLPTSLKDMELDADIREKLLDLVLAQKDIAHNAYPIERAALEKAFDILEQKG